MKPHSFIAVVASRNKPRELNIAKQNLHQPEWRKIKYSWVQIVKDKLNCNPEMCPHCKTESLIVIKVIGPQRGPPCFRKQQSNG